MKHLVPIFLLLLPAACRQPETTAGDTHVVPVTAGISWSLRLPAGWEVLSREKVDALETEGKKVLEETIGDSVETIHENLVNIMKDPFNSLLANRQQHDSIADGPYAELQNLVFSTILDAYRNRGIRFDHATGTDHIDGLAFRTMSVTVFAPKDSAIIMQQVIWDRLIGDHALMINMNFNDETNRETLVNCIKESKFIRRGE